MLSDAALRAVGRRRPDLWLQSVFGVRFWPKQIEILQAVAVPNSVVAVPSCFSSGKTFVAGGVVNWFHECFEPSKVMTTSTDEDHLKLLLWGEIRSLRSRARIPLRGQPAPAAMYMESGPNHFALGRVPRSKESFQGWHSTDIMLVGDEATSIEQGMAEGIRGILASGNARELLIFNPTNANTYAADVTERPSTTVIRIRAWDTPHFAHMTAREIGERFNIAPPENHEAVEPIEVPPGSALLEPRALDVMLEDGHGPGTYAWQTKVEAEFWTQGANLLIVRQEYDRADVTRGGGNPGRDGALQIGIDFAPYGDAENVIGARRGNRVIHLKGFPAMRPELFVETHVTEFARELKARDEEVSLCIYDADGPGAGAFTALEKLFGQGRVLPFRGAIEAPAAYQNMRSMWWWMLRTRFQVGDIVIAVQDSVLRGQLTNILYGHDAKARIKVESKQDMHKRGVGSPDRGDVVMMMFAFEPPVAPTEGRGNRVRSDSGEDAYWARREAKKKERAKDAKRDPRARARRLPRYR